MPTAQQERFMRRNYIGLASSFHDSALAIVNSHGQVVFAEATERSLQSKRALCINPDLVHHAGDIVRQFCEPDAEIVTARSWTEAPSATPQDILKPFDLQREALLNRYGELPEGVLHEHVAMRHAILSMWATNALSGSNLDYELGRISWPRPFVAARRSYDHHLTHAATACFGSPFEEAVCAVVDGVGEGSSCAFFSYRGGELKRIPTQSASPGSLGFFYVKVCLACGFGILTGEEWKAMGLAAYGTCNETLVGYFRKMIRVNGLSLESEDEIDQKLALYELRRQSQASRSVAADVAYAGQLVFTETLLELLGNLSRVCESRNLVLCGGCALNSSANGTILSGSPFRSLHVPCAPADDGNAIGAALLAYQEDHPRFNPRAQRQSAYLGSSMSAEALRNVVRFGGGTRVVECGEAEAPRRAAQLLSEGKIIGWIQGRAEFGPRALGNRSILADPRPSDMKDRINARVKFREEFRPFAPSILHECGPEYFEDYQPSPFMERTLKFRESVRSRVPAVVHVDGTGRLQSVSAEGSPGFYDLIEQFRLLTGVPLVLNTSFNVMGKPIAHSVEDVLAVFYSSGLDAVFIDGILIEK
jgi:carbamoyltransferase